MIDSRVARGAAVLVPLAVISALALWGREGAETLALWSGASLVVMAVAARVAYMLTTGQFPPRIGTSSLVLPPDDVEDAGQSLDYLRQTLVDLVPRVERLESALGIADDGTGG